MVDDNFNAQIQTVDQRAKQWMWWFDKQNELLLSQYCIIFTKLNSIIRLAFKKDRFEDTVDKEGNLLELIFNKSISLVSRKNKTFDSVVVIVIVVVVVVDKLDVDISDRREKGRKQQYISDKYQQKLPIYKMKNESIHQIRNVSSSCWDEVSNSYCVAILIYLDKLGLPVFWIIGCVVVNILEQWKKICYVSKQIAVHTWQIFMYCQYIEVIVSAVALLCPWLKGKFLTLLEAVWISQYINSREYNKFLASKQLNKQTKNDKGS